MGTNWETAEILKTPMEVCWQFDYEIESAKLKRLYSNAKRDQWDGESELDWDTPVDPSRPLTGEDPLFRLPIVRGLPKSRQEQLRSNLAAYRLSQTLHGEQGALMTSAALTHAVPDYEGKLYSATQTMDEARHIEVFERYVKKLGRQYPIGPFLKRLIDTTLQADSWVKIAIGMNMVVEGLALGSFQSLRKETSCDLLRSLLSGVLRDESRHVAFGGLYVGQTIRDMHPDDREDVAQFTFDVVRLMVASRGRRDLSEGFQQTFMDVGIEPDDFIKDLAEENAKGEKIVLFAEQYRAFRQLMMPGLVRVGAITRRTRLLFAAAGIQVWDNTNVLEKMESQDYEAWD